MSKKAKTMFFCQECGYESPKWLGQCICGAWNSMVEERVFTAKENKVKGGIGSKVSSTPQILSEIATSDSEDRMDTGSKELNRVLGGGIVKGSLILISGEPGIGKSTLIMQVASNISKKIGKVLYVSGEESKEQIKLRSDRICSIQNKNLYILSETNLERIEDAAEKINADFIIIDSIQTMYTDHIDSAPGSVSQVRACGNEFMRLGKEKNIPVFIVAHVTKNGELAGPKNIEHLVDCVLHFTGERTSELRILRAFKNRFGNTSEIGAFEMCSKGLIEIEDLSKRFLNENYRQSEGSVITAVYEGSRPLLIEVQALVASTNIGFARRTAIGIDQARLNMLLAVLERKAGLNLVDQDVYVNIVGGLKPEGTSSDLAIAIAIHSTLTERICSKDTIAMGEIGLTGEIRSVQNIDKIIGEAIRMGFKKALVPKSQSKKLGLFENKIEIIGLDKIEEATRFYYK